LRAPFGTLSRVNVTMQLRLARECWKQKKSLANSASSMTGSGRRRQVDNIDDNDPLPMGGVQYSHLARAFSTPSEMISDEIFRMPSSQELSYLSGPFDLHSLMVSAERFPLQVFQGPSMRSASASKEALFTWQTARSSWLRAPITHRTIISYV